MIYIAESIALEKVLQVDTCMHGPTANQLRPRPQILLRSCLDLTFAHAVIGITARMPGGPAGKTDEKNGAKHEDEDESLEVIGEGIVRVGGTCNSWLTFDPRYWLSNIFKFAC